jgi:hypothetical protein
MVTEQQIDELMSQYPERRFLVHNGYLGWSWGSPMNPTFITARTAKRLLELIAEHKLVDPLRAVLSNQHPLQYANEGDNLYCQTEGNRFIAFLDPKVCSFDEGAKNLTEQEFEL